MFMSEGTEFPATILLTASLGEVRGFGGGGAPPTRKFFLDFWSPNSDFWCTVGAIFTVQWTVLDADGLCVTV